MAGNSRWSRSTAKKGAISRWWGGALLAAGVAMTFGAASCGGSGGNTFFFLGDGIWVADQGAAQVDQFNTTQLIAGIRNISPRKIIQNANASPTSVPTFTAPQDTLFDGETNLWVVDGGSGTNGDNTQQVFEFAANTLKGGPLGTRNVTPTFFISDTTMVFPQFAVFDSGGDLYVSDPGANVIFKFTPQQLTAVSGPTTAAVTLTDDDEFDGPLGMAFDSAGNLWVANNGVDDTGTLQLLEFKASTLAGLSGVSPVTSDANFSTVTTTEDTPSLSNPWGLNFDAAGNLWVTNETPDFGVSAAAPSNAVQAQATAAPTVGEGTVVEFSAAQIAAATADAAPTPVAAIVPTVVDSSVSLDDPQGIFVDRRLKFVIVANDANASLSRYNTSSIGAGGALTPTTFVAGDLTTLDEPTGLSIGAVF